MLEKLTPKQKMLLGAAGIILLCIFVLGSSIVSLLHNKLEMRRLAQRQRTLEKQYEVLQVRLQELQQQDPQVLEALARSEYHMVKPGEIEFRFTNDD